LILARELASNLATPMFLIGRDGLLAYYNDAAERMIGKPFGELGQIDGIEFGADLGISDPDGTRIPGTESPAGRAFFERRPSHRSVHFTGYDGVSRAVEATAYPLLGATDELHGVVVVFWEDAATHRVG
jgi:PAS domain-containing protein